MTSLHKHESMPAVHNNTTYAILGVQVRRGHPKVSQKRTYDLWVTGANFTDQMRGAL